MMKANMARVSLALAVLIGFYCLRPASRAAAADAPQDAPSVIKSGFNLWTKRGATYAFDEWQKGGLLEDDRKPGVLFNYFRRMDRALGNYKSYDLIDTKQISPGSQVIYLAMNFEHAAVYARFLLYRTEKGWVVQNMDFSPKPEAIMPWLAFNEGNYSE